MHFKNLCLKTTRAILLGLLLALASSSVQAASSNNATPSTTPITPAPQGNAAPNGWRNFYEVLDDLLADFEYDLKNSQVTGLKDISIRNIATSENIPASFKTHLELTLTEKILKNTHARVIQCLPCRSKRTTLNGDQVVVTSADTNPVELARIAKISNISNFLDVAFSFQPTGMMLSMFIADPETGTIKWSRSYNSESSRASAFRRGVDYSSIDEARKSTEYIPTIQYRGVIYYMFEKNPAGYVGCLGAGFRMMERYDNRRKEVGFELDYFKDSSTLVAPASTDATIVNLYSGINFTLLFMHAWNLFGDEENYNQVRGSVHAGIGGTYASGFLGGLIRGGYEWRLAKHWAVSTSLGYRPASTAFLGGSAAGIVSGMEFGIGINGLY